jgi:hypothetical protein
MTYDPFQTYATQDYGINPAAAWNPLTAYQGQQPGYPAFNHQQQFNPQAGQNPTLSGGLSPLGFNQGVSYNPLVQQLAAHQLAQQILAQQLAAQAMAGQQIGQIGFGGQAFSPFHQNGLSMAPQSWVGQAGQAGGVANPILLAHLTARALQAQGIAPGVNFPG